MTNESKKSYKPQPVLSRRVLLRGALGLSGLALLAACGGDDDDDDAAVDPTATPAAEVEETGTPETATRELEDMFGSVTVPNQPQRVIADSNTTLGNMLALGVKPVGTGVNLNSLPTYLADQMEGIVDLRTEDGIDIEKALTLDPDLMIAIAGSAGETWNAERCESYKAAMPTFCYDQSYVYEEDIKGNVSQIAVPLGVEEKAAEVLAEFDAHVADLRAKVAAAGFDDKPMTVVRVFSDGTYSIRIGTTESIIFRAVGIPQPEGQQNPEDFSIDLSIERLNVLNDAYVVIIYIDDNSSVTQKAMLSDEIWQTVPAVQEERVVFVNSGIWNSIDIQGAHGIMDDIENLVLSLGDDATEQETATAGDAFPITIEHKFGATTIESAPERIVSIGLVEQDALLALGAAPIATREWFGEKPGAIFPWAEEYLGDAELPERMEYELDFELIAALEPDVIIGLYSGTTPEEYEILSQIAPTVAQPEEYVDWGIPWQALTVSVGQILGKQAEAEELVGSVERQFATVQADHPEFVGASAAIGSPFGLPEDFWIYSSQDGRGRFLTRLGFEIPEVFDELAEDGYGAQISVERLELLADLDLLIWIVDEDIFDAIDLYRALPVVQAGRVLHYGESTEVYDGLNFSTVLSLPYVIEQLVPALVAAIDGDPETEPPTA